MEKFAWNLPNKTNRFFLKFVGLWPDGDSYKLNLYSVYTIVTTVFLIYVHNFCQTINIFFIDDLSLATAIIFVALSDIISILKLHAVVAHMKTIKKLMKDIDSEISQPKNDEQKVKGKSNVDNWKKVYGIFLTLATATVLFWAIFPILDATYKTHRLPFLAWYPYDYKQPLIYELTYLHQIVSISYIALINVNVDSFTAALMVFVGAQCDILCDDLKNLHLKEDAEESFIACVLHHKIILRFAEDSNRFFDIVVLAQFFTSAISLGLTMFQLTVVTPFTNEFYSFLMYEMSTTVQIFMYCWFGNEAQFKSSKIPSAAYEFDWTNLAVRVKKNLIVFIARTQRPIKFSAMDLFYLSLETFTRILRTAWSYFAVLNNIKSPK